MKKKYVSKWGVAVGIFSGLSIRGWQDIADIVIVAYVLYRLLLFFVGTRAMQLTRGIFVIVILFFAVGSFAQWSDMRLLKMLGGYMMTGFVVAVIVVFQPELRSLLEVIGRGVIFHESFSSKEMKDAKARVEAVFSSIKHWQQNRIGALLVFQHETGLKEHLKGGRMFNTEIHEDILETIFYVGTPLHDGAIVMDKTSIIAASCYLPLSDNPNISRWYGTRHRAAVGVTEVSDARVLIISEETGKVSMAVSGKLTTLDDEQVKTFLNYYFTGISRSNRQKDQDDELTDGAQTNRNNTNFWDSIIKKAFSTQGRDER